MRYSFMVHLTGKKKSLSEQQLSSYCSPSCKTGPMLLYIFIFAVTQVLTTFIRWWSETGKRSIIMANRMRRNKCQIQWRLSIIKLKGPFGPFHNNFHMFTCFNVPIGRNNNVIPLNMRKGCAERHLWDGSLLILGDDWCKLSFWATRQQKLTLWSIILGNMLQGHV